MREGERESESGEIVCVRERGGGARERVKAVSGRVLKFCSKSSFFRTEVNLDSLRETERETSFQYIRQRTLSLLNF